jgi:hypothetical protein
MLNVKKVRILFKSVNGRGDMEETGAGWLNILEYEV